PQCDHLGNQFLWVGAAFEHAGDLLADQGERVEGQRLGLHADEGGRSSEAQCGDGVVHHGDVAGGVENVVGTPVGECMDLGHDVGGGPVDHVGGAEFADQLETLFVEVDGDDDARPGDAG